MFFRIDRTRYVFRRGWWGSRITYQYEYTNGLMELFPRSPIRIFVSEAIRNSITHLLV